MLMHLVVTVACACSMIIRLGGAYLLFISSEGYCRVNLRVDSRPPYTHACLWA